MSELSTTSSGTSKKTLAKRYPRLACTIAISDTVTGKSILSTLRLSPEQLQAYGMGGVLAAYQTLIGKLGGSKDFLDFLEVADPLWKSLLLEYRGATRPSECEHPLAQKYNKEDGVKKGELYDVLSKNFGIPAPGVSTFIVSVEYGRTIVGYVVVVGTPIENGDTIKVLMTVSQVVQKGDAEKIEKALWEGHLQIRFDGKVYSSADVVQFNPQQGFKTAPQEVPAGGGER